MTKIVIIVDDYDRENVAEMPFTAYIAESDDPDISNVMSGLGNTVRDALADLLAAKASIP